MPSSTVVYEELLRQQGRAAMAQQQEALMGQLSGQSLFGLGGLGAAMQQGVERSEYYSWEHERGCPSAAKTTKKFSSYREELQSEVDEWLK